MSNENVKALGLVVLYNIVVLVCFTIMSILMNKWWLILISLLLYKGFSYKEKENNNVD